MKPVVLSIRRRQQCYVLRENKITVFKHFQVAWKRFLTSTLNVYKNLRRSNSKKITTAYIFCYLAVFYATIIYLIFKKVSTLQKYVIIQLYASCNTLRLAAGWP